MNHAQLGSKGLEHGNPYSNPVWSTTEPFSVQVPPELCHFLTNRIVKNVSYRFMALLTDEIAENPILDFEDGCQMF